MAVTELARRVALAMALAGLAAWPAAAQTSPRPSGRLSVHVNTVTRTPDGGRSTSETELSTAAEFESPEARDSSGVDYRFDIRQSQTSGGLRPSRVSVYDAYVGGHMGERVQMRVRAGHMWLSELGTVGSLAGGLVEVGQARAATGLQFRAGAFGGREPNPLTTGYAAGVTKMGGYAALESGFLRRHLVGYTRVTQSGMTERSVLSVTNFVPAGSNFFLYQTAEYDVKGPAQGAGRSGLSYFLANARLNPMQWLEVSSTYNRGRSIDARTLTSDLLNGRPLTPQATEGLRYESAAGRASVQVFRNLRVYVSYGQDRTNRDDAWTGRITWGGYASNVFRTGLDVSGSDALIDRPTGSYHSRYLSVGRSLGRAVYVSGDYSTSLSVVQFLRSDGLLIETRPWTRRYSGSANVTLNRSLSLLSTVDYTLDEAQRDLRLLSGLSYRFR